MKKADVVIGGVYVVKVSGWETPVRIDRVSPYGGWEGTNIKTGRRIRIKSAQRLRRRYDSVQSPAPGSAAFARERLESEGARPLAKLDKDCPLCQLNPLFCSEHTKLDYTSRAKLTGEQHHGD
jgi:hypothetical protein